MNSEESLAGKGGGEAACQWYLLKTIKLIEAQGDLPSSWLPLTSCLNVWCSSVPNLPGWGSSKVKWAEQGVPTQQEGAAWAVPSPPALRGMERSGVPPAASHSPIRCAPLCSQPTPGESRNPSGASGAAVLACAGGGPVPKIAV